MSRTLIARPFHSPARVRAAATTCLVLVTAAVLQAQAPAASRPTLEQRLLAALQHEDPSLRATAAYFFGLTGDDTHVDAVGALVDDDASGVRHRAIKALHALSARSSSAGARAAPWLLRALHDGVEQCRHAAAWALGTCAPRDSWNELASCLGDPAPSVRIVTGMALARLGAPVDQRDVVALVDSFSGGWADKQIARSLDLLTDPAHRPALEPLLGSHDPAARNLAQQAAARLDTIARGAPATWRSPAQRRRERYAAENAAAAAQVQRLPWHEVERAEVLAAVKGARLVLFGEMHWSDGPLREAQRVALRAWAGEKREHDVLGFEPSVEHAQRLVLGEAAALDIETRSLEPSWKELSASGRHAERDDEAAKQINAHLAADPENRMFVIRGESHVLPEGYLVRQLEEPPVIVLGGVAGVPLRLLGDESRHVGRTFRLGASGRVFVWVCHDPLRSLPEGDALRRWLEAR